MQGWLAHHLDLPQYVKPFEEASIDGLLLLKYIDEATLNDELGVRTNLHRKKIMEAIAELRAQQDRYESDKQQHQLKQKQQHQLKEEEAEEEKLTGTAKKPKGKQKAKKKAVSASASKHHKTAAASATAAAMTAPVSVSASVIPEVRESSQISRVKLERSLRLSREMERLNKEKASAKAATWGFEYTGASNPLLDDAAAAAMGDMMTMSSPKVGSAHYQRAMQRLLQSTELGGDDAALLSTSTSTSLNLGLSTKIATTRPLKTVPKGSSPMEIKMLLKGAMHGVASRLEMIEKVKIERSKLLNSDLEEDLQGLEEDLEEQEEDDSPAHSPSPSPSPAPARCPLSSSSSSADITANGNGNGKGDVSAAEENPSPHSHDTDADAVPQGDAAANAAADDSSETGNPSGEMSEDESIDDSPPPYEDNEEGEEGGHGQGHTNAVVVEEAKHVSGAASLSPSSSSSSSPTRTLSSSKLHVLKVLSDHSISISPSKKKMTMTTMMKMNKTCAAPLDKMALIFTAFIDQRNNGASWVGANSKLTRLKFSGGIESLLRLKLSWAQFDALWSRIDYNKSGEIDIKEFKTFFGGDFKEFEKEEKEEENKGKFGSSSQSQPVVMTAFTKQLFELCDKLRHAAEEISVMEMFRGFDRNGSGSISVAEFCSMLRLVLGRHVDKRVVYDALTMIDEDCSKTVSVNELCVFVYRTWKAQMKELLQRITALDENYDAQKISQLVRERNAIKDCIARNFPRQWRDQLEREYGHGHGHVDGLEGPFTAMLRHMSIPV
jgi:Ca2+-binding EF-hand superfamily protein